ncbi:hypothetical protein D3C81_1546530 [compost metagenome]
MPSAKYAPEKKIAMTSARLTPTCSKIRRIIEASNAPWPCGWMLRSHSPYMPNTRPRRCGITAASLIDSGSAARIRYGVINVVSTETATATG